MIVGGFVDQMVESRFSPGGGVDYGAEGKILVIYRKKRLLWRKGHNYWSGLYMPWSYAPARLEIQIEGDRIRLGGQDILEGGRLTLDRIVGALSKIRKLLDLRDLRIKHFDLKKTFVIKRVEDKK